VIKTTVLGFFKKNFKRSQKIRNKQLSIMCVFSVAFSVTNKIC
jgi:hypothetical protein